MISLIFLNWLKGTLKAVLESLIFKLLYIQLLKIPTTMHHCLLQNRSFCPLPQRRENLGKKKIKKHCLFKNIQLRSALSSPLVCVGLHFAWSFPKDNACRVNKSRNENSFCSTKNLQAVALYSLFISDTTIWSSVWFL